MRSLWRAFWTAFRRGYAEARAGEQPKRHEPPTYEDAHAALRAVMTRYDVKRGTRYMAGRES